MTRCWLLLAGVALLPTAAVGGPADDEFFEKRIRPVLSEHCQSCHGEKKQKGGLRLDSRAAALNGGDLGPAVVPGKPDDSLLIKAIRLQDDLVMPPNGKLPDAVTADLVEWVKRGAPWPGYAAAAVQKDDTAKATTLWSLQPIRKPDVPTPKDASWAKTDIDRFLLVRMEAAGLAPAPPADARTLARRLSFDLTGLPPTPERVAAFEKAVAHDRAAAVREYVAELLASPAYGEKWGRHWLDVARYSDSNGSEVDHAMANAWRYRDYVIRAFTQDKPFDRFVKEQLAGDLLPDADPADGAAPGFLMFGPKALAELDKDKLLWDVVDEQVDTAGRAFLGLTLGCARCHDHKFDPISAADYYAVAGIFRSTTTMDTSKRVATWVERPLDPADVAKKEALARKADKLKHERDELSRAGRTGIPKLAVDETVLVVEAEDFSKANVRVDRSQLGMGIGVVRTKEEYPDQIEYEFDLPAAGEYQLEIRYAAKVARPTHLIVNGNLEDMDAANQVTGDWGPKAQKWFVQGTYPFRAGRNTLAFRRAGPVPLFDKFLLGPPLPGGGRHSDKLKPPKGTAFGDPETAKKLKALDAAIAAAVAERERVPSVMAPTDGPAADVPVLVRGNPATPGPVVPRGVPGLGRAKPQAAVVGSGRREFADWVASGDNPLTARVIVNRVWLWHFGEGLVRSPDNFCVRGEVPTHPELLDWLATWFIDNGWSVKKLHTLICNTEWP